MRRFYQVKTPCITYDTPKKGNNHMREREQGILEPVQVGVNVTGSFFGEVKKRLWDDVERRRRIAYFLTRRMKPGNARYFLFQFLAGNL